MGSTEEKAEEVEESFIAKSATEVQRFELEKDKLVTIPEKNTPHDSKIVHDVMDPSAGANSSDLLINKQILSTEEYTQQKLNQQESKKKMLERGYRMKLLQNKIMEKKRRLRKSAEPAKMRAQIERARQRKCDKIRMAHMACLSGLYPFQLAGCTWRRSP